MSFRQILQVVVLTTAPLLFPNSVTSQENSAETRWLTCYLNSGRTIRPNWPSGAEFFVGFRIESSGNSVLNVLEDPQGILNEAAYIGSIAVENPEATISVFEKQGVGHLGMILESGGGMTVESGGGQPLNDNALFYYFRLSPMEKIAVGRFQLNDERYQFIDGETIIGRCVSADEEFLRGQLASWNRYQRRSGR